MSGIIQDHVDYHMAISRINEINPRYFENLEVNFIYKHLENFRIVKIANGSDMNWYLLHKRTNIISRFFGLFTKTTFQWYVVCGCDRGSMGYYAFQADTACNPYSKFLHTIPDFLRAYLGNRQILRVDREGFPNGEILNELDIRATLTNLKMDKEADVFHSLAECAIFKEQFLDKTLAIK